MVEPSWHRLDVGQTNPLPPPPNLPHWSVVFRLVGRRKRKVLYFGPKRRGKIRRGWGTSRRHTNILFHQSGEAPPAKKAAGKFPGEQCWREERRPHPLKCRTRLRQTKNGGWNVNCLNRNINMDENQQNENMNHMSYDRRLMRFFLWQLRRV